MTVPVAKDDENYTTVMVSLSNHESLSFVRLRMTRVEINNNRVASCKRFYERYRVLFPLRHTPKLSESYDLGALVLDQLQQVFVTRDNVGR